MSESLIFAHFLFFGERCEWIAHFAHQKWATMSDSLRSLRGNERCERITHFAHQKWANEWIAHFFGRIAYSLIFWKNEQFARKSNEQIPSPGRSQRKSVRPQENCTNFGSYWTWKCTVLIGRKDLYTNCFKSLILGSVPDPQHCLKNCNLQNTICLSVFVLFAPLQWLNYCDFFTKINVLQDSLKLVVENYCFIFTLQYMCITFGT